MSSPQTEKSLAVCESLIAEHRLMEGFLLSLENRLPVFAAAQAASDAELAETRALLDTIRQEMNVHFACEERALFPAISPYHPMVLMEVEHEELVGLRDEMLAGFDEGRYAAFADVSQRFIDYLRDHIAREDGGVFPACERDLPNDVKQRVIEEMNRIRAQSKAEDIPAIIRPEKSFEVLRMDLNAAPERPLMVTRLAEKPDLQVKHLTIRAGESLAAHWTPKRLLVWCVTGEAVLTVADEPPLELQPGSGALLDPQLNHAIQARTDCHLLLVSQDINP